MTTTDAKESTYKSVTIAPKTFTIDDTPNPAAPGFDRKGSDNKAIVLADSVMMFHGGRKAWDSTRYLQWDFFGKRSLSWDKQRSRVRIDIPDEHLVYLLDYSEEQPEGRMRKLGDEVTDSTQLAQGLERAMSIFRNDAFWLVHHYKLKDTGVTLKYAGVARVDPQRQRPSHIIDQYFSEVGDTPGNRYRLFIDKVTYRINTWQFFRNADDTEPAIETPWNDYLPYGQLLLSGDRGGKFQLTNIAVKDRMDERVFTSFD